jgi:hypothetical protein
MPIEDCSLPDPSDPVCRLADKTGGKVASGGKTTVKKGFRRVIFLNQGKKKADFRIFHVHT